MFAYTSPAPQIAEDQSRRQSEQDRVREEIRQSEESRALKDQDEKVQCGVAVIDCILMFLVLRFQSCDFI
jgi:hypothetical protein